MVLLALDKDAKFATARRVQLQSGHSAPAAARLVRRLIPGALGELPDPTKAVHAMESEQVFPGWIDIFVRMH